jgi:hypothetical protein
MAGREERELDFVVALCMGVACRQYATTMRTVSLIGTCRTGVAV